MSTGSKLIGDCLIDGSQYVDQVLPNNNITGIVAFNEMTTAELAAYNDPESTIVKNSDTGELFYCKGALRSQITNQIGTIPNATTSIYGLTQLAADGAITPANSSVTAGDSRITAISNIAQTTFLGRRFGAGFGAPQTITPTSQFNFSGTTVDLIQPLNNFNNMNAVLNYQIANDTQVVSTSSVSEVVLKTITINAGAFLVNDDNVWGTFSGSFVIASGQSGTVRVYINNVLIAENQITSFPSGSWSSNFDCARSSATNLRCGARIESDTSGSPSVSSLGTGNVVFNPSLAFTIQLRAVVSAPPNSVNCQFATARGAKNV